MWAKLCIRKGNSPDRPLRSQNQCYDKADVLAQTTVDVGLEAAIHLKSAYWAHCRVGHAPTIYGAKHCTDQHFVLVVGELSGWLKQLDNQLWTVQK